MNIVSPGGFPSSITIEDVLAGRSETRNKAIARVFKELDYIEQWGSGIKRIFSWCEEAGVAKPLITEKGDFVDVELYREYTSVQESVQDDVGKTLNVRESVRESVRENVRENLNQKQINTLNFCLTPRTSKEILDHLDITYHSKNVRQYITELVEMELLARENPNPNDRNQKYITTEAGKLYIKEDVI